MLRRNDSVNVPAMAAAYLESFSGQLLPASQAVGEAPTHQDGSQQNSMPSTNAASAAAMKTQQAGATVDLKTFKDLMDDLRCQVKDINALSDKVQLFGNLLAAGRSSSSSSAAAACLVRQEKCIGVPWLLFCRCHCSFISP